MPIRCAVSHSAAISSAVYRVPSSVLCVIDTTPGWAWCCTPTRCACSSSCAGTILPSVLGKVSSFEPRIRSGAPVSSTAMWAHWLHTMQSAGRISAASAITLAPVPFHTSNACDAGPNRSRNRASASAVHASEPYASA